jgi:hypothetical protein
VSPHEAVELAAGYVGVSTVGVSMVLGLIDMVMMVLVYVPSLRSRFNLAPRWTNVNNHQDEEAMPPPVVVGGAQAAAVAAPPPPTTALQSATEQPATAPSVATHGAAAASATPSRPNRLSERELQRNLLEDLDRYDRGEEPLLMLGSESTPSDDEMNSIETLKKKTDEHHEKTNVEPKKQQGAKNKKNQQQRYGVDDDLL